jgi:PD-(D/E)XK nuclease superfamily
MSENQPISLLSPSSETPIAATAELTFPEENKLTKVSFSQYAMYLKCPHSWCLNYAMKMRKTDLNINLYFGTAMHHAIQTYIEKLYTVGESAADDLNVQEIFIEKLNLELEKDKEKYQCPPETLEEYIEDGRNIIRYFLNKQIRNRYFHPNKFEFVGVELPIDMDIRNNVRFVAFIDLVLRDKKTNKIVIYDFKTSNFGWNNYTRSDITKYTQVLLYKGFYAKKYNVDLDDIEVLFFLLVRNPEHPDNYICSNHIDIFVPSSEKSEIIQSIKGLMEFVEASFTPDGEYNLARTYSKNPGKNYKNCDYCAHFQTTCDAGKVSKKKKAEK